MSVFSFRVKAGVGCLYVGLLVLFLAASVFCYYQAISAVSTGGRVRAAVPSALALVACVWLIAKVLTLPVAIAVSSDGLYWRTILRSRLLDWSAIDAIHVVVPSTFRGRRGYGGVIRVVTVGGTISLHEQAYHGEQEDTLAEALQSVNEARDKMQPSGTKEVSG